jgi:hypothetical protein
MAADHCFMMKIRHSLPAVMTAIVLAAGSAAGAPVGHLTDQRLAAQLEDQQISDGMPSQASTDLASTAPGNSSSTAGWGDMPGGVAARPYVTDLTVINGPNSTPVIVDRVPVADFAGDGGITTVVSPVNLCKVGATPQPGQCYATPNRVALTVGYRNNAAVGYNFRHQVNEFGATINPAVDASTVIDMTVALNTLGRTLRWSWVDGELLYWQASHLGQPDATVHIRFRPAPTPYVQQANFAPNNGCTATPIFNCVIPKADAETLTANILFSLDGTLDSALTGAVFATQNAIAGYLAPSGTPQAPVLDVQAASTHTMSDGSPQYGTIQALLPAATLLNLYGVLPTDASGFFAVTRTGDPGHNDPATYTPWTAASQGTDGLLVTVRNITFSVPKYKFKSRLAPVLTRGALKGTHTTVTATVSACRKTSPCLVTLYDLGSPGASRFVAKRTALLSNRRVSATAISLEVPASRLGRHHRYLLVVRSQASLKLLASAAGAVA